MLGASSCSRLTYIPKGSLGTFGSTGPIRQRTPNPHPAVFTTYLTGSIDQPLTQNKISLGIHARNLDATSPVRTYAASARKIAAESKRISHLVATQAGVDAAREAEDTRGAERVTTQYETEKKALRGDVLDSRRVMRNRGYDLSVFRGWLVTQREALKPTVGRDVATPFRVDFIPEQDVSDLTLDSARQEALANRRKIGKRV